MIDYQIKNLKTYPKTGEHQYVEFLLPFSITKGMDEFWYIDKDGNEKCYNCSNTEKTTKQWIIFIENNTISKLKDVFEVRTSNNVEVLIKYAIRVYKKALKEELKLLK